MSFPHRIRTIYRKELVDILRDRRTLTAMIIVPIVLYPLLMLGSIQAVSYQAESLGRETVVIGVVSERQKADLLDLITADGHILNEKVDSGAADPKAPSAAPLTNAEIHTFDSRGQLEQAVRDRVIQVGVVFRNDFLQDAVDWQNPITVLTDQEEVRSDLAARRFTTMLQRLAEETKRKRLRQAGLPEVFTDPFRVTTENLSAPSSILGQILPLVLVLMTITGAIYPAIDLTAGERERGTLESLMVCPVPVIDLIVGKFLVVTTVAIMGAALNLASVSATIYFGGFDKMIAGGGTGLPIGKMAFILACLVPFAVLMSAIMIAVCSFARTFKEAQNYVTPLILAVLIPGGIAALPASRLEGVMLVMPVGNMVLLARDLMLGGAVPAGPVAMVLLSTTLYATAAVAIAAGVFGRESVVFADAGSLKAMLSRKLRRQRPRPALSFALLIVAVLFPIWFFVQSIFSPGPDQDAAGLVRATAFAMPILFVLSPAAMLAYSRVGLATTFALRWPSFGNWGAALLLGLSAWVPAHELNVAQQAVFPLPSQMSEGLARLEEGLESLGPAMAVLLVAVLPAVCEELLFRGLLLSGLATAFGRGAAILISAAVFAVFHFWLSKIVPTLLLGAVLGYLCWQSRSIVPGIIVHGLHNGLAVAGIFWPWPEKLGIASDAPSAHLPATIMLTGSLSFLCGLLLCGFPRRNRGGSSADSILAGIP